MSVCVLVWRLPLTKKGKSAVKRQGEQVRSRALSFVQLAEEQAQVGSGVLRD